MDRRDIIEIIEGFIGFGSLLAIIFFMTVIGG